MTTDLLRIGPGVTAPPWRHTPAQLHAMARRRQRRELVGGILAFLVAMAVLCVASTAIAWVI